MKTPSRIGGVVGLVGVVLLAPTLSSVLPGASLPAASHPALSPVLAPLASWGSLFGQDLVEEPPEEFAEDPVPVLLVPGWGDGAEELAPLQARFVDAGWSLGSVRAVDFEDPVGSSREHAEEVAAAVRALGRTTGSPVVDIVAHSMGGLAVRHFLETADADGAGNRSANGARRGGSGGARNGDGAGDPDRRSAPGWAGVRKVVFLGTPHRGTVAAWFAWGEGGDEMQPGSPFLDSLNTGGFVPDSVEALAIQTPLDLRVIPGESAVLPEAGNTRNVEICCPTHPGLLDHDDTFRAVVEFLREER